MENEAVPTTVAGIPAIETCCVCNSEIYGVVFATNGFERTVDDDAVIIFENDFCTLSDYEFAFFRDDDIIDDKYCVAIPYTILIS